MRVQDFNVHVHVATLTHSFDSHAGCAFVEHGTPVPEPLLDPLVPLEPLLDPPLHVPSALHVAPGGHEISGWPALEQHTLPFTVQ